MQVVWSYCAKAGKPALIREKDPLDDPTVTYGNGPSLPRSPRTPSPLYGPPRTTWMGTED